MGSYTFLIPNSDQDAPVFITDAEYAFDQLNTSVANHGGVNFCLTSESLQIHILASMQGVAQGPRAAHRDTAHRELQKMCFLLHVTDTGAPQALVVLAGQGVGHQPHQLLPRGLAGRGELLAEVSGQDDDQDVTQQLQRGEQEGNQVSRVLGTPPSTPPSPVCPGAWPREGLSAAGQGPCAGSGHEHPAAPSLLPLTFSSL